MRGVTPADRKTYIIVLVIVAVGILIAGVAFRPQKEAAPVRSESEFLQLQLLTQRRDLERRSFFFQTKAGALVGRSQVARAQPQQFRFTRPKPGATILLIATDSSGQPVWASATTAGYSQTQCKGRGIEEIETTITIPRTLRDATAFDLEESVAGFVVPCGDRRILTTREGFAIFSQPTVAEKLLLCCGLEVAVDPASAGFQVAQLAENSRLARAGLKVSDRIAEINGRPLESLDQLEVLTKDSGVALAVQRGRSKRLLKLNLDAVNSQPANEDQ